MGGALDYNFVIELLEQSVSTRCAEERAHPLRGHATLRVQANTLRPRHRWFTSVGRAIPLYENEQRDGRFGDRWLTIRLRLLGELAIEISGATLA